MEKISLYLKCPLCNMWNYLGRTNSDTVWNSVSDFTSPFTIDYRTGGGRAKGFKSKLRLNKIPKMYVEKIREFTKRFYLLFNKFVQDKQFKELLNIENELDVAKRYGINNFQKSYTLPVVSRSVQLNGFSKSFTLEG